MAKVEVVLSKKDEEYREFSLNGNMWKVVLHVGLPLALFQGLTQIFKILDSMMASYISATSVSAVAYLSQINMMIGAIGGGLAVGGSLKISQAYGEGDYEMVKKRVNSLFALCALLSFGLLFLIPFTVPLLRLANTPEELITIGSRYFELELIGLIIWFFNNVYICVERARGNSKRILYLNLLVIAVKLLLTAIFVYVLKGGITMISVATILSQLILFIAGGVNLNQKGNAFGLSLKSMTLKRKVIKPMLSLSFPVIVEKVAFSFGKVIVNSMSGMYGSLTVGALGISNSIGGLTTNPQNGFQDGGAAIISQNLGAGKPQRALDAFKKELVINVVVGIIGLVLTRTYLNQISIIFSDSMNGMNYEFREMICNIYKLESLGGCIPLAINATVISLMLGFGYTKCTLLINFCRIFIFRIPVLWGLQHFTTLGNESVGIVMLVSNVAVTIFSCIVAWVVIKKICKEYQVSFWNVQEIIEHTN
ncbi:putative MATE family efflux protein [Lachnotalea glycerini]|jgi:putative MATE family efflux protein|uniref:MATE family efflux transporter n=1 Tax=Lachnotalea glycerini TaxID=1763509 RepID=A0A255I9A7_9FIRM|nr:MATE family efflux transporter [Lachnotalea glycerini]PXV89106.1 putative MATE family efflux protein [Lachnotalea glycerini]RDY30503.1 MATE family efflux transporter [Lachnotalea glycerini]